MGYSVIWEITCNMLIAKKTVLIEISAFYPHRVMYS